MLAVGLLAGPLTAHAEPFAYVANFSDDTVSVIDTASNTVIATVAVGSTPSGVAITPDGAFAYVANAGSDNVSVIDTASNAATATLTVGSFPNDVAITPSSGLATLLQQLLEDVTGKGAGKSLANKIKLAQVYYEANDIQATCAARKEKADRAAGR
jgi:YVTN family beta-propeller protein